MARVQAISPRQVKKTIHSQRARSVVQGHSRKDHKSTDYKFKQEFWRTLDLVQRGLMSKKERAEHLQMNFNVII